MKNFFRKKSNIIKNYYIGNTMIDTEKSLKNAMGEMNNANEKDKLKIRFSKEYEKEFNNILDEALEQCFEISDFDDIDEKINQCKKALNTFENLKDFCYSKGDGGKVFYDDEMEFLKQINDTAYTMQEKIKCDLDNYLRDYDKYKKMGYFKDSYALIGKADLIISNIKEIDLKKIDEAYEIINEALRLGNKSYRLSMLLKNLGDLCYENDLRDKALLCYENGLKINDKLGVKKKINELKK